MTCKKNSWMGGMFHGCVSAPMSMHLLTDPNDRVIAVSNMLSLE